ncbi:MAG: hypothetical protein HLUCCA08_08140 [Rhodobacteraceae bacterium HLUCCA08]|nr:MAG: hypothetical protein HLUCCA08_08140 [Rhodobacteraceae bacterium HLUCCA08]
MHQATLTAVGAAILLGGPAMARCPETGDLAAGGIVIEESGGVTATFRAAGPHVVHLQREEAGGYQAMQMLGQGVNLMLAAPINGGLPALQDSTNYAFREPAAEMPVPAPGLIWQTSYGIYASDHWSGYDRVDTETMKQGWAATAEQMTFGDCTLEVLRGTARYEFGDDGWGEEELWYFPALGLAHVASWRDIDFPDPDNYEILAIRAVAP